MGAANEQNAEGSSRDMDTSMSVLGKRTRTKEGAIGAETAGAGILRNVREV